MTNKNIKTMENAARLIGVAGFILFIASPTGAELGNYGLLGFMLRALLGVGAMLASGQIMRLCDILKYKATRKQRTHE